MRARAPVHRGLRVFDVGGACSEWNEAMPVLAGALEDRG